MGLWNNWMALVNHPVGGFAKVAEEDKIFFRGNDLVRTDEPSNPMRGDCFRLFSLSELEQGYL